MNSTRKFSKGFFFILLLGILCGGKVFAQIPASSYGFTPVSGTYADIVGGTAITGLFGDDNLSSTQNIGFTFNYCGTNYTQLKLCSNGWASFNTSVTSTTWTNSTADLNTIKPALMPLFDDLAGWGTGAAVNSVVTGLSPNRVYTVEFKNWSWRGTSGGSPHISFQIKLYETTNVIEYSYRQESGTPNGGGATIGIGDGQATPTFLVLNNSSATPTASSTTFTTNITTRPANGQTYRFTPPPACNTVATLPTSATTTASPATLCLSGNVTLSVTPNIPMPAVTGVTYQWQTSPTATGTYTNIAGALTTLPTYTTTVPITASAYFRAVALCNGTTTIYTSSASNQVVVNNPGNPTPVPGSRCGPGSVALSASAPTGNPSATLNWYTSATGGAPVQTGTTYNTPYITATTNFYVAASSGGFGSPTTLSTLSTGGNGCSGGVMFDIDPNVTINIDSFKALPESSQTGQIIKIYTKTGTYLGSETNAAAWTLFATLTVNTTAGQMVNLALPTPLIINANVLTGVFINYDASYSNVTAGTLYSNADLDIVSGAGLCSAFSGVNPGRAFNGSVHYRASSCEGNRVAVAATVNTSPVVAKTAPAVVCNNSVATITVTPPTPPYPSYNWTPTTNLYTDAGGTVPYTGGSATTVYLKTTNVGTQSVYLMAGNPALTTGCTFADTVKIWVQPGNVTIKGNPDTICVSGASTLKLDTIAGYYPASIQWQTSTNGTTYTDITGATASTYVTPSLSFGQNTYYKALVKAGSAVCQSPSKYVVVANPTLISAPDSFNCGPGTVTLTAVTAGNGSPVWYSSASGGFPIATGSPFVTPYLGATTSYYVASRGGGASGLVNIGLGANVSGTQDASPFPGFWGGAKMQYLIKSAEIAAQGIPVNAYLTSLAVDVVTPGVQTYPGMAISMKNTTAAAVTTVYETPTTEVFPPTDITPTAGINTYNFATPFIWTGGDLIIQICWSTNTFSSNPTTVRVDNTTYASSHRGQMDNQTPSAMCSQTSPSFNATPHLFRPKFVIGFDNKCETPREEVIAHIYPKPIVDLGQDINKCVDQGSNIILDAGIQPNNATYRWDDSSTSQIRAVSATGNYSVVVTNQYTCSDTDSIHVIIRLNPDINLGNDTSVCNGVVLTLNPGGNGTQYFWNTGQTGAVIQVNTAGSYNVFVTNAAGCISADTIVVDMQGELPTIGGIQIDNNGQYTFHFTPVNPQNVIGYDWDFGDGSTHSNLVSPTHTYQNDGNYTVVLLLSSSCGFAVDTLGAHIVGIHQINVSDNELTVYPNPTNNIATISVNGDLKMERIEVYNVLGQVVYKKNADSKTKHSLDLGSFASGMYTIQIYTDKGTVGRKLEVRK